MAASILTTSNKLQQTWWLGEVGYPWQRGWGTFSLKSRHRPPHPTSGVATSILTTSNKASATLVAGGGWLPLTERMGYFSLKSRHLATPSYIRGGYLISLPPTIKLRQPWWLGEVGYPWQRGWGTFSLKSRHWPPHPTSAVATSILTTSNKALATLVLGGGWLPLTERIRYFSLKSRHWPPHPSSWVPASILTTSNKASLVVGEVTCHGVCGDFKHCRDTLTMSYHLIFFPLFLHIFQVWVWPLFGSSQVQAESRLSRFFFWQGEVGVKVFMAPPGYRQSRDLADFFLTRGGGGENFFFGPSRLRAKSRLSRFFFDKGRWGWKFLWPLPGTGKVET